MTTRKSRRPLALANWKMAMTIPQSLAFIRDFMPRVSDVASHVEIVICPPYTALRAMAEALAGSPIALGGQDLWPGPDEAHTGAISGPLLADAGAIWVMAGHWEVRRRMGENDTTVNLKIRAALAAGLRPILLLGEGRGAPFDAERLETLLAGCGQEEIARMAFVYEPEGAIGQRQPVAATHAIAGCRTIRHWLTACHGTETATQARIIYGGSVAPEYAPALLADPDIDGLGASRQGRDPAAFAQIVRQIARARSPQRGD